MGAQEQEAGFYQIRWDTGSWLCKDTSETLQHKKAGCKMQAGMAYLHARLCNPM